MSEIIRLGDIADIDASTVDKKSKDGEQQVRLCNFVDVYYNWMIVPEKVKEFMEATANQNQINRFSIKNGQVAITKDSETRDDIGIPTYISGDYKNVILGYHCTLITPDRTVLNGEYLNAVLHTDYARKYFSANASGSGQRYTLAEDVVVAFPVPLIPLEMQARIGKIFSDLALKEINNNYICADLENMIKLLYEYWFVQFDFPDKNGQPYKSSGGKMVWSEELNREIPEGWEVVSLDKIVSVTKGVSYSKNDLFGDGIPMINLNTFNTNGTFKLSGMKTYSGKYPDERVVKPNDLVMCVTQQTAIDLENDKDVIGKTFLIPDIFDSDITMSMDVIRLDCKSKEYSPILRYLFNSKSFHRYISGFATGTKIKHLDVEMALKALIVIPPKECEILHKFYEQAISANGIISKCISENVDLQSLRDMLLPMLINRQAKLKEV